MRKSFKTGKKIIAVVLTLFMVISAVHVFFPAQEAEAAISDAPATEKKLIDNGDGTYTLALSVTGEAESSTVTQATKANVVLVIDTSSSMNQSSGTTTPIEYTEFTGEGTQTGPGGGGTQYYGIDEEGEYTRVYWRNTVQNGTSHWRLTNSSTGPQYTGTVYTRSGGNAISRLEAEKDALTKDGGIIDELLSQNVPGDSQKSDIIEIAVVNFDTRGHYAQDFTTNADSLKNTINSLGTATGTNWEEGLAFAEYYADNIKAAQPDEDVYIIFLTDGEPTTHAGDYSVNTNYAQEWGFANDNARTLVTDGYIFYALFTWGSGTSSHYLSSLVQYAYTGAGNSDSTLQPAYAQYFTDASDTATLIAALEQIVSEITESVGFTDVEMTDGVTSMTTSTVKATASGEVTGVKYYRSGGSYGTGNGGLGTEWTDAPKATINDNGEVDWDLGSIVLENGVTYTITFVVWPSQESLDLVADLNNGVVEYESLTDDQKSQISVSGGHYSLKTNTDYPTVTYSTVTTTTLEDGTTTTVKSDPQTATIVNPDPVGLTESKLNAVKGWDDSLDESQREEVGESVILYLLVDGEYYYVDEDGKPLGVTLTESSNWTETDYIAIAPGIMVTEDSPAYDPDAPQVTWEGETYAILESGHDYVFEESDINYHFELTAYHHHPMVMGSDSDGNQIVKDVMFTTDDSGNITGIESVSEMGDNLSATNTLKPGIDIVKKVVDANGEEIECTDSFEVTVYLFDAEGNTLPEKKTDDGETFNYDYRIYYGENNPNYDPNAEKNRSDHIYGTGTSFTETLYVGDTIRVVNLEIGSVFRVEETEKAGYELVSTEYEISRNSSSDHESYTDDEKVTLDGETYYPTEGNSASKATLTNKVLIGDLEITKTVEVVSGDEEAAKSEEFTFTVNLYEDDSKEVELTDSTYNYVIYENDEATGEGEISSGSTIKLKDGMKAVIEGLPAGAYYEVTEEEAAGYTTDKTGDTGTIAENETVTAEFTNTYDPGTTTATPEARKEVDDQSDSAPSETFEFELVDGEGTVVETVTRNDAGDITFSELTFEEEGTYEYSIREVEGSTPGFTYDTEERKLQIEVKSTDGVLEAEITYLTDEGEAVFTNVYKAEPTGIIFTVNKEVEGTDGSSEDFTFVLKNSEGTVLQNLVLTGAGTKDFNKITYTKAGTYNYTVTETAGDAAGYTYDTATYEISVSVEDIGGELEAIATITKDGEDTSDITFTNTYAAEPVTVELSAKKTLEGRTLAADEFEFTLELDGEVKETVKNAADGSITFSELEFTDAGEYTVKISEVKGSAEGVTYDETVYEGTITVTDDGSGTLTAEVEGVTDVTFKNTYEKKEIPPGPPTGDDFKDIMWLMAMMAAIIVLVGMSAVRSRRKG
ncbi:MAG: hypothetical protein IJM62_08200 [Lachnospiraceae bacterium]|nr:hypothetical protein [Lachnospiraceae bacterium]